MAYYINAMTDIKKSNIKYQYLDHMETTIDIRQNYWQFYMQLFCINNFNLPPGTLVGDLDLPYQEVKDISFFLAPDQTRAKAETIPDHKYCHIYESTFNVDVSGNEFFKQDISNTKINCSIRLEIDPQIIKDAGVKGLDQTALDTLIAETAQQRWDFAMYYSNTQKINNSGVATNINGYQLDKEHECSNKISLVDVSCNKYDNNTNSINELVSFESNTPFQIIQAKVKFYYWLEYETEAKTLDINLELERKITNQETLYLNQNTLFDYVNNKVVWNSGGINGFYIPKHSHGYYEIEILLNQTNNTNKFVIRNDFVFKNNISSPQIGVSKTKITNLIGFRKVIW